MWGPLRKGAAEAVVMRAWRLARMLACCKKRRDREADNYWNKNVKFGHTVWKEGSYWSPRKAKRNSLCAWHKRGEGLRERLKVLFTTSQEGFGFWERSSFGWTRAGYQVGMPVALGLQWWHWGHRSWCTAPHWPEDPQWSSCLFSPHIKSSQVI